MAPAPISLAAASPPFEIARPDQHRDAVRHEFLSDLKSNSLIGPGYQGDAFVIVFVDLDET